MWESLKTWFVGDAARHLTGFRFEFNAPAPAAVCVLLLLGAVFVASYRYWPRLARMSPAARGACVALRGAIVFLILFMLLDPCIVGQRTKPGEHYVLQLFDDSRSMRIVGEEGLSRGERLKKKYGDSSADYEEKLKSKYQLASYRFGEATQRVDGPAMLGFDQRESRITASALDALTDLEGMNVSAVVLFSDGIEQSAEAAGDLKALADRKIPVFAVGVDTEQTWRDLEIGGLGVRRTNFDRSPVDLAVPVRSTGLSGEEAIVEVVLAGKVVRSERIQLRGDRAEQEVKLEFVPEPKGWIEYEVRARLAETGQSDRSEAVTEIAVPGKDRVIENNTRRFIVDNREKAFRILYFCGRPNWENKFFRRALEADPQLHLTSLIRISKAEKKFVFRGKRSNLTNPLFEGFEGEGDQPRYDESVFLRFGARESELDRGYPSAPEELFPYHLVIFGDVEHDFFSRAQLELTRDFVSKRGGTLLMMGGPYGMAEGGYNASLIESMFPLMLRPTERAARAKAGRLAEEFGARPTIDGALSGAWALDPNPSENERLWREMPELTGVNDFALVRAGATILARAGEPPEPGAEAPPLFAIQRFGEGRCAVLATGTTWQWQMEQSHEDEKQERLWRQIVRSLVTGVPDPVLVRSEDDDYTDGREAAFDLILRDAVYDEREALRVSAKIKPPSGAEVPVSVEESIQEAGLYRAEYLPETPGMHVLSLSALDEKDAAIAAHEQAFLVEADQREFQKAQFDEGFLKDIAAKTGGEYLPLERLSELAEKIPWLDRNAPDEVRFHLWHFPGFFAALIGMMCFEWLIRRKRGYA